MKVQKNKHLYPSRHRRSYAILFFVLPVKVWKIVKTAVSCYFKNAFFCCKNSGSCFYQAEIIQIFNKTCSHIIFKKLHKMWWAVVADFCYFFYWNFFSIMLFHICKYFFDFIYWFFGFFIFFLFADSSIDLLFPFLNPSFFLRTAIARFLNGVVCNRSAL